MSGRKIAIHKALTCKIHSGEQLSWYCLSCQTLGCTECSKTDYRSPQHHCEAVTDAEVRVKQDLESLLTEGKVEVDVLLQTSTDLDSSLNELAHQKSTEKDLINESYQSYKAVLERGRDDAHTELNELYNDRELKIMEMTHTESVKMLALLMMRVNSLYASSTMEILLRSCILRNSLAHNCSI